MLLNSEVISLRRAKRELRSEERPTRSAAVREFPIQIQLAPTDSQAGFSFVFLSSEIVGEGRE